MQSLMLAKASSRGTALVVGAETRLVAAVSALWEWAKELAITKVPPRGGTPLWHASAGQDSHGITHAHDHGHAGVLIHRALHPSIIRRCAAEWSSCMCTSGNGAAVSHVSQDRGQSAAGGTEALTLRWAGGPCGVHRSVGSQSPKGQQVRKLFRDVSSSEIAKQLRNGKESLLVRMVESGLLPQTKYPNRYKGFDPKTSQNLRFGKKNDEQVTM